ncbi:MAG: hypothetical protein ACLFSN_00400 [Candidatus Woesearchaeota archaeon]
MADSPQPQKTDAHLRFDLFKKAENRLLEDLREHEREIKRLMAELETIRNLVEEASDDIEDEEQERLEEEQERVEEQRRALEEVVNESAEMRREEEQGSSELPDNYTPVTSQRLTMAASYATRQELYELQEKEEWTPDDAYRFFEISDAVRTTQQYSFSAPIQENITMTYDLLQNVAERQQGNINENYNPSLAGRIQTYQPPRGSEQERGGASLNADNENYRTLDRQLFPQPVTRTVETDSSNRGFSDHDNLKEKYKPGNLEQNQE